MIARLIYLLLLIGAMAIHSHAQQETLNGIISKLQAHQQNSLQEKVFVHLDRTYYVSGETMWLKVYVVDGYFHQALDMSKVVYIEMLDRQHQPILQTKISLEDGRGHGTIHIPSSIDTDQYTIRAYTHWMKNFSADFYFHQTIPIVNVFQRLEEKNITSSTWIDAQFFPEGGHLVDGIESKVGFRVIDSSGKGIVFNGYLLNNTDTLIRFVPLTFGIGHFTFTPHAHETYRVVIKEKNGNSTTFPLPSVSSTGFAISVVDTDQNQLKVTVHSQGINESSPVYLISHNRQMVKSAMVINLKNGKTTLLINKDELGEGIIHLTLFNQHQQPVCERLYFNRPTINTSLALASDKPVYEIRNKITLQTRLLSKLPGEGHASLSVYKKDSLSVMQLADIESYLWLTSDLKGIIESPSYYFSKSKEVDMAMDNLMLTHGWSKFNWDEVMQSQTKIIRFIPEFRGHILQGQIAGDSSTDKLKSIGTYLSSPDKIVQPYFARSDRNGKVIFETHHLSGQRKLIVQTMNGQSNTRIILESPFSSEVAALPTPYLKITERWKEPLTQRSISMQAEDIFHQARVKSNFQRVDSTAFYGDASEHYLLDDYTRFPLLEEVMREYVKGVRVRKKENTTQLRVSDARRMTVFEREPLVLLDGVPIINTDKIMEMDPLKIRSIDVMTSRYYLGEFYFDGIISLKTYSSDLGGFPLEPNTIILDYDGLQERKEFYAPRYETASSRESRLPDQRNLLVWLPNLTIDSENEPIEFYASDQTGIFQAVIQGISSTGKPIYKSLTFEVKAVSK